MGFRFALGAVAAVSCAALALAQGCATGGQATSGGDDGGGCTGNACDGGGVGNDSGATEGGGGKDGGADGGPTCPQGQSSCAGADGGTSCFDLQTDTNHCGNCTTTCLANLETCTAGQCASTCTGGKTLCIPDGGVVDGGPTAHCADLQNDDTDCGDCFNQCPSGAQCQSGKCVSTLLGSGTASDPWHTATPLANCAAYKTEFPSATDGVYTTHPSTTDIGVYCDMTSTGVTYENFGMGQYSKTYTGWTRVGSSTFSSTEVQAAFAYLFTRNAGLTNIDVGFVSTNCCFIDTNSSSYFGFESNQYMYPGSGTSFSCNPTGGYTATIYPLYLYNNNATISSITASQAGAVTTSTSCSVGGNPAIFVKMY